MEKCCTARKAIDDTTWHMHFAYLMTKASDTHSGYVILVTFLQQEWLCEHVLLLLYMYIACIVL